MAEEEKDDEQKAHFGLSLTRRVYISGESKIVDTLRDILKVHSFIAPRTALEMPKQIDEPCFLIYAVDFSNPADVQKMVKELEELSTPNLHKLIYVKFPLLLQGDHSLLCAELGARMTFTGNHKDQEVKEYIKNYCVQISQIDSIQHYEDQMQQAINSHEKSEVDFEIKKLRKLPASADIVRLIILGAKATSQLSLMENFLKKMLHINKQDLWAANELGKMYLKSGRIAQGVEILERMSHFHEKNSERMLTLGTSYINAGMDQEAEVFLEKGEELTAGTDKRFKDGLAKVQISRGNQQSALALVGGRGFSSDVISYLNMKAVMCLRRGGFDEGIRYYEQALEGAKLKLTRAKLQFNIGLAYARHGLLTESKKALNESLRLGGNKFKRAQGPLQVVHKVEKSIDAAADSFDEDVMDDMEFETLI
jgi:tetratricopeptide (TPR) repeat protein